MRRALHLRFVRVMVLTLRLSARLSDGTGTFRRRLLPLRHRRPALGRAQIIDEQLPIKVIDLVLDASSEQLRGSGFVLVAVFVGRPNRDLSLIHISEPTRL